MAQWLGYETLRGHAPRLASFRNWGSDVLERSWIGSIILAVAGLLSVLLLGYGIWLLLLERGARALAHGEADRASELYTSAERPFHSVLARLFPDQYSRAVFPKIN